MLRGHPHLHVVALPDVHRGLLQRGLMRAGYVILGELGQGGPQIRGDVGFYLFQLRIIKHRCLRGLGGAFTGPRRVLLQVVKDHASASVRRLTLRLKVQGLWLFYARRLLFVHAEGGSIWYLDTIDAIWCGP